MGSRRKLLFDEEQVRIVEKGKMKVQVITVEDDDDDSDEEESEDDEALDVFEDDGFIVGCDEDEEQEEDNPKQTHKGKKKRRRSSKCIVLDDDDLELIRENKILGINQKKLGNEKFKRLKKAGVDNDTRGSSLDDGGSLFDDIVEDEHRLSDDAEDDMADFIVDEEVGCREEDSFRQRKFSEAKHFSSLLNGAKYSFDNAGPVLEHNKEVQLESTEPHQCYKSGSLVLTNVNVAGKSNCLDDIDIPERMQIFEDIVGSSPVDRMSIEEESAWILSQLDSNPLFSENKEEGKSDRPYYTIKREDIVRFLELHHAKKYDIPFIAMYRKEQCLSLLEDPEQEEAGSSYHDIERKPQLKWHKVLWIIRELDKKWLLLQKRKSTLMTHYNDRFKEECQTTFFDEKASFNDQLSESLTNMLKKAESDKDIDDIEMQFNLHFPPVEGLFDVGYKRPVKETYYSKCTMAGLWSLASKLGKSEKFVLLNTREKVEMEEQEDPNESPEELASTYKCATFETSEAVLKGARHMAAVEISCEISLRKYVRSIYMNSVLVSTSPTPKGDMTIDTSHQFAGVKWLLDKPLTKFRDAQWLIIQKAEEEKLLQVKIRLSDCVLNELTMSCNDVYLNDSEGPSSKLWNEQRASILKDAISNFLLPSMEKEARALLTVKAKNWLTMEYGKELWNRVSVAPCLYNDNAAALEKGAASKVMACCLGTGKPGTTFVMLDSKGELVDMMHAGSLTLRSQNINDQQRRKNDQQCVLKFLTKHQPHIIVIGAANASCIRLRDDINEIISMMLEENFQDVSQEMKRITTVLGDESLPRLYEDSEISEQQLPRQHAIVKRAVALGRYHLNPLAMVATLCGIKKEILSWKLNPLDQFLTIDEKFEIIEWIMADITNQVGIDINLAISHDWLSAPLQFVSGLGPRKADILCRELLGGTAVVNRRYLSKCGLNTMKVFWNAVGFLKVSCNEPIFVDTVADILDRTRIHPESYHLAEEFARAVYRDYNLDADASKVNVIELIHDNPKLLESFDLNEFAARLEVETGDYKREILHDIKVELIDGFKDPRRPYKEPTQDEEFFMITGETGDVPIEGRRVQAVVRHVKPEQAFCMLDSGLTGVLFKEDFSDETDDISLTEKLREGVVLNCKIKSIDKNRYRVTLTCKASELKSDRGQVFQDMDPYYCQGKILPGQQGKADKEQFEIKHFKPRTIFHPCFQNMTADQAKEFLADKAVGDYIFHPSCRGLCKLTLTLKIFDGLCVHKDIIEGGKTPDIKSLLGLGKTLKIGEEIFVDIDKVIECYVNPLVVHLKAMLGYKKFKGSKAEVDQVLKLEKEEYPKTIVYGFAISFEHPGTFVLSYIRSTNPRHEFIGIHPKGFKFRKQIFDNVEQLVAYFQNHINDSIVPVKKPFIGGSSGESIDGGQRCNAYPNKQSIGSNGRGDRGRGRGRGRGHGCGRGDGRGRRCGRAANNQSSDRQWGPDYTLATGKGWDTGGSGEVNAFSHWNSHESSSQDGGSNQALPNDYNWEKRQGKGSGWSQCYDGGGESNKNNSAWGSIGNDHPSDGSGWSQANSSVWTSKVGKSWGEDTPAGEGNAYEPTNDCGWGRGRGRGPGRGSGRGWSQGDGGGDGREHKRNNNSYSGGWGNAGTESDNTNGGGWANAKSSGWKGNIGKSWRESVLAEDNDRGTTNFWQKNNLENGMHNTGNDPSGSNEGEWGQGQGRGRGRGRGSGRRGSQGDNQRRGRGRGRGRGHEGNSNSYSNGRWASTGSYHTSGGGGWSDTNSSGWGGNKDKSWSEDGLGEGNDSGTTNSSHQNSHECNKTSYSGSGWGSTGNDHTGGWGADKGKSWSEGGFGEGNGSGTTNFSHQNSHESGMNATGNNERVYNGRGWGRGQGQGRGRGWSKNDGGWEGGPEHEHDQDNKNWGKAGSDHPGGGSGGWGNANSSGHGGKMEGTYDSGNWSNKKRDPDGGSFGWGGT